jgi:hypothetical protein
METLQMVLTHFVDGSSVHFDDGVSDFVDGFAYFVGGSTFFVQENNLVVEVPSKVNDMICFYCSI